MQEKQASFGLDTVGGVAPSINEDWYFLSMNVVLATDYNSIMVGFPWAMKKVDLPKGGHTTLMSKIKPF